MDREEILNAIKDLAQSQGLYGRLYRSLTDGSEQAENMLNTLVEQNFKDKVDLVLYIEG